MNKKGFILTEAIIVSSVVLTTLVLIYSQFAKINKNYGDSYIYDSINGIYALKQMSSYLQEEDLSKITDNLETFIDISDCNLSYYTHKDYCEKIFLYSNLDLLFVTYNDKDAMYNTLSETNNYGLKLLNYIKSIDDSDDNYSYRLVGVFKDGTYASIPFGKDKYRESLLCGATPVLKGGMVPVTIDDDGTVKVADLYSKWYKYKEKRWANAVILSSNKSYSVNEVIPESDIKQYYVWIPRYRYQLWNVDSESLYPNEATSETAINIVFESKNSTLSNGNKNGEWLTHPAFTSFDTNGIWVGKYETSYNESSYTDSATFLNTNPNYTAATTGIEIIIKPNVRSLTNKTVSEFYTLGREVNESLNSHMMKNSEWGAVAYLTYSNYGKCTDGVCEEVYINNVNTGYFNESTSFTGQWQYSGTITGCSGASASAGVNSNNNTCESGYAWNEANNKASTTGNTSGIYDMSGGNCEYMMAVIKDSNGNPVSGRNSLYNSGFNGTFGCPTCDSQTATSLTTGIDFPRDTRYYDLYDYNYDLSTDIWYDYTTGHLGDATKEIAATKANSSSGDRGIWYSDYAHFPSMTNPWFVRGGYFNVGSGAGLLSFRRRSGHADSAYASRVVLAY